MAQPIFQPVNENVLPSDDSVSVRSAMPGNVASVKGDTAAGNNKPATVESGYTLQVPSFVEEGTLIQIDTRTGEYQTRV